MSTHATIAYLIPKTNTVTAVYLHNDGEFNSAGILLNTYYNTDTKVKTLINLGNLCILAPSLEPPLGKTHNFDHRYPGVTIAYHRDRGENLTIYKLPYDANIMENLLPFLQRHSGNHSALPAEKRGRHRFPGISPAFL